MVKSYTTPVERRENFEQNLFNPQFKLEKMRLSSGKTVDYVDIKPPLCDGNSVGYFLGWTGQVMGCRPFYEGFYKGDKRVISIQYPTHHASDALPGGFSPYGQRNAEAFAEVAVDRGVDRLDLVGHSEGAGTALMAAIILKQKGIAVDNIILVNPSGIKNFSLAEGAKRLLKMKSEEGRLAKNNKNLKTLNKETFNDWLQAILHHPLNTALEGLDVGKMDMPLLISKALQKDIHIGIIQSANDPFVPYEELGFGVAQSQQIQRQEVASQNKMLPEDLSTREMNNPLLVSVPESTDAGHLFSGFYPQNPNFYVPLTVDLLNYFRTGEIPLAN